MGKRQLTVLVLSALVGLFSGAADGQDVSRGALVFAKCAACHSKDDTNRSGPGLLGIVGRHAGSASGFHYSRAMKSAGIIWDEASLDAYIAAPQKKVPGNTMPFSGIENDEDRADLVTFLNTLK